MIQKLWVQLRSSLWFVPGLLVLCGALLAVVLVYLDVQYAVALSAKRWQPLLNTGAEGARGMLTAIASSMITVAGVAFSVTIVTLSLASTQYTPRIVRNFMRQRANQFVLGVFVAVYTYCLIVLRSIRGGSEADGSGFVPLVSVAVGLGFALVSIVCLIYFIHHTATSIQASTILKVITAETTAAVDNLFPDDLGEGEDEREPMRELARTHWQPVRSKTSGYVQHIDGDGLLHFAEEQKALIRIEAIPGDFVSASGPLIFADRAFKEEAANDLRALFVVGDFRTTTQDAGFGIRQIVDIAMKALSPGVNDTSTAVSCLDYLSAILIQLADRQMPPPYRKTDGDLRVIAAPPSFAHFAAKSFDEVRLNAKGNVTILLQLLRSIERVVPVARNEARRETLLLHANLVRDLADSSVPVPYDRARIDRQLDDLRETLRIARESLPALAAKA